MDFTVLPTVNATLNGVAFVFLIAGVLQIRKGRVEAHRSCMIAALVCSGLFLTSYLVYHYQVGSVRFQGTGPVRTVYLSILLTHTVLGGRVVLRLAVGNIKTTAEHVHETWALLRRVADEVG